MYRNSVKGIIFGVILSSLFFYSCSDNCIYVRESLKPIHFTGRVEEKFIVPNLRNAKFVVVGDDTVYVRFYERFYDAVTTGDIVGKDSGELEIFLVQGGDTSIFLPQCR